MNRQRRQRGVALLIAVIIVALATIAATAIAYNNALAAKRGVNVYTVEQSLRVAQGAEAWAAYALREDRRNNVQDDPSEVWGAPYGPVEMEPGVTVEAGLEDMAGRFNINMLIDANGVADPVAQDIFRQLLQLLGMESRWAGLITDWIDVDTQPAFPDGAEDGEYAARVPAYRAPNIPITSISELLALPDFGRANYEKLAPYVSALPHDAGINHCAASGVLLDALLGGKQQFSLDNQILLDRRMTGCFPTAAELQASMPSPQHWAQVQNYVANNSQFFRLRSYVTIGTTRFTTFSLLNRDRGGQIRVVLRSFGTE